MNMKSDIEIAQSCPIRPITEIAETADIDPEYLELYGKYKAKVDSALLRNVRRPDGKLVLVTAIGKVLIHVVARMPMGRGAAET